MPEQPAVGRGVPPRDGEREPSPPDRLREIYENARFAAQVASDIKAVDIRIMDMHELVSYTDYLVVCSGRTTRQTRRIAEEIGLRLKRERNVRPGHVEGEEQGEWILMDYLDFVVHVFTPDAREFYRLDALWKEAPSERFEDDGPAGPE